MKEYPQFSEDEINKHWDVVSPFKRQPEKVSHTGKDNPPSARRTEDKRTPKSDTTIPFEHWDVVSPYGAAAQEAVANRARAKKARISNLLLKATTYGALIGAFGIYVGGEYLERHPRSKTERTIPQDSEHGSGTKEEHGPETAEAKQVRDIYGEWAEDLFKGEGLIVDTSLDSERAVRNVQVGQFKAKFKNYTLSSSSADGRVVERSVNDEFEITSEEIRNGLKSLPPAWVYMRFKRIDIVNREIPIPSLYNIKDGKALAQCERCDTIGEAQVTYSSSATSSPTEVFSTLPHEVAHGNDCWTNPYMNPEERQKLALQLADRLSSDDRYNSSYVESINNKDAHTQTYLKAREYFSEIVEAYYKDPGSLNVKDARIVVSQLKRGSPGYDCVKGQKNYSAVSENSSNRILHPYFAQLRAQEHAGT